MKRTAYIPLKLSAQPGTTDRRGYLVTFIQAGRVKARDGTEALWEIPASTLQAAAPLLEARPCFLDHAGWFDYPALKDMAGVTFQPVYNAEMRTIDGGLRLYDSPAGNVARSLFDQIIEDERNGLPVPDVGLSLVFFGRHDYQDVGKEAGEEYLRVTTEITYVESADLVFGPGAQGRVREILSGVGAGWKPALPEEGVSPRGGSEVEEVKGNESNPGEVRGVVTPPVAVQSVPGPDVLAQLERLSAQVERLSVVLAAQAEGQTVHGMGLAPVAQPAQQVARVQGMWNSVDQITLAYERLMGLLVTQPVHRLSGIRELYTLITGDRDLRGVLNPELSMLAYSGSGNNADTTSMAEITRNVMNKVLVQQWDILTEYHWWERLVRAEDFDSLKQISWVRVGGIGDLPTVAEKGEYTQLAWDDARVAVDWIKKGGYLPLSLEMIDTDDVQAWREVPRILATSGLVTLSADISALFTDNSGIGPSITTEGSTAYAFSSTWGNLITQPLDPTNWGTAIQTMYELSQLNVSGRAIAVRPKYLLVAIENEEAAIGAACSDKKPGTDFNDKVPTKRILPEDNVITVPHWTDADNWAAVADPNLCPFAGVGFRFGRIPELFTAGDAQSGGLLFTNDVLPIKCKFHYAVGIIDPRGAIKSNV